MTENVNLSWNSSLNNKSWVELIEEEEQEELNNRSKEKSNVSSNVSFEGLISKRSSSSSSFFGVNDIINKSSPTFAKSDGKVSPINSNDNDKKDVWSSIRNDKFEIINEESVNSCSNTRDTNEDSSRDDLFDFAITNKFEGKTGTTAAKVIDKDKNRRSEVQSDSLSKGLKIEKFDGRSNGTNEELSLTGHLDIFHVDSPSKVATTNNHKFSEHVLDITCEDTMFSPIKLSSTSAVTPVKDALAATRKRSSTFSNSPSKRICRSSSKLIAETQSSTVTNFSQGLRNVNSGTKNDHSSSQSDNCDDFRKPYDTRRQSRIQHKDNPPISRRTRSRSKLSETDSECSPNYKRSKRYSSTSSVDSLSTNASTTDSVRYETNSEVLTRRQKQIDYGKNTLGYERYIQLIPKDKRGTGDPKTPPKNLKYSRRAWDGLIKSWRLRLHKYDPESNEEALDCLASNDDAAVSDE